MIELSNVALPLDAGLPDGAALVRQAAAQALGVRCGSVADVRVLKRSVDARKKGDVHFVATLAVAWPTRHRRSGCWPRRARLRGACGRVPAARPRRFPCPIWPSWRRRRASRAPWWWARGRPGCSVRCTWRKPGCGRSWSSEARAWRSAPLPVAAFEAGAPLDPHTNVQFGEGGAGAFSDGKLTTGTKSPHTRHVLEAFVHAGAPEEILWQAKPHIGTDLLPGRGARLARAHRRRRRRRALHTQL